MSVLPSFASPEIAIDPCNALNVNLNPTVNMGVTPWAAASISAAWLVRFSLETASASALREDPANSTSSSTSLPPARDSRGEPSRSMANSTF